jgi:hypothetical protein
MSSILILNDSLIKKLERDHLSSFLPRNPTLKCS